MISLSTLTLAALATGAWAGSIKDIKHVVLFMQENRGFDHYFGTMAGVRGFADPNVQINPDGRSTFEQPITSKQSSLVDQMTPYYQNYLGGNWSQATQCTSGGGYSWQAMHSSLNGGLSNKWVSSNSPYTMGYFKRQDISTHWDVADGYTIADMYTESILAATDPNRISWMSGTVNNPGSPSNPDGSGGMMLDNSATPGCEMPHVNCYPLNWKTVAEYYQAANVSWQVYQDPDNFEDNMLAYFQQYQDASNDTNNPLTKFGNSYPGLEKFYEDAREGNLPMVSWIIGPGELSEHQPYLPSDGAWLYNQIIDAVTKGKSAKDTALLISYDEVGGYFDHVVPFHAPAGTEGEWIDDPYNPGNQVPVGPGYRVPFFIVSPWTRGGNVFTEHADHTSQIMFVETWLQALGYSNITSKEVPIWRRAHMSNLVNAFDFDHPDYTLPTIASAPAPLTTPGPEPTDGLIGALSGNYIGAAKCLADYPTPHAPVPYGSANAHQNMTLTTEEGFKQVRGALTEGRYLTFEIAGQALTSTLGALTFTPSSAKHDSIHQRWILHQQGAGDSNVFTISSAADGRFISSNLLLTKDASSAQSFTFKSLGNSRGYTITDASGSSLVSSLLSALVSLTGQPAFSIYSVTYHY